LLGKIRGYGDGVEPDLAPSGSITVRRWRPSSPCTVGVAMIGFGLVLLALALFGLISPR
jgi:hypothetical protein